MVNKSEETIPILTKKQKPTNYGSSITDRIFRQNDELSYPKAVIFVLCSKFFESFAANGVRTVLALYLRDSLNFTEESSTSFYHIFNFFSQFCPIFGAVLADSYFGNAKTIFYLFFIYAIGWIGTIAITFPFGNVPTIPLVVSSLILVSIGNGSIRACITSLGGMQFKVPEQSKQLNQYFSHYYFVYTMGIMLSKIIPPSIRAHTQCFGKTDCYSAVFGALGAIFLTAWIIFLLGMFFYKDEEVNEGNILFQVIGCIWHGAMRKLKGESIRTSTNNSWIDGAIGRYSESFVHDVSAFLKVLKLFIPLPIYWSLYTQIDSSWTFQATQLNTTVFGIRFEADQAKAMGGVILLTMIPVWQNLIIPLLASINIRIQPLQSVALGGLSAAMSFVCAAFIQMRIEGNQLEKNLDRLSILWQLPQFFLLMMGEVLLSIPGLQFSFTQAPPSMKSVLTASWFCNNAFGNIIVVAITQWQPFKLQSNEYFLYAILMLCGILFFCWIASNYQYTQYNKYDQSNGNTGDENSNNGKVTPSERFTFRSQELDANYYKSQENMECIL